MMIAEEFAVCFGLSLSLSPLLLVLVPNRTHFHLNQAALFYRQEVGESRDKVSVVRVLGSESVMGQI